MTRHILFIVFALVLISAPAASAAARPPSEVVLEAGGALPQGNLGDDYFTTDLGLGNKGGLELGFRLRYHLNERWSLSPAFHFVNFKDFKHADADGNDFRIKPTSYRYTLELLWTGGAGTSKIRPITGLSVGLYRNRLEAFQKTDGDLIDSSVNTLGAALRGGLKTGDFELSVVYGFNEFDTWSYFATADPETYDWSTLGARAAWVVPFGGDK